jgi:hypothetical protein
MCIQTEASPKPILLVSLKQIHKMKTEMLDISSVSNDSSCKPLPSSQRPRSTFSPISLFGRRKTTLSTSHSSSTAPTSSFPDILKRNYQARIDEEIATMKRELRALKSSQGSSFSDDCEVAAKRRSLSTSWSSFPRRRIRSNSILSLTPTV